MSGQRQRWPWVAPIIRLAQAAAGIGDLTWEFMVDHLHHWPPTFVLAFWLLGGPLEQLILFLTSGRVQINIRPPDKDKDEGDD